MTRSNTGATLAALLAAVVAAAHCAPSGGDAGTTTTAAAASELPQWHNPCGMSAKAAHPQRHRRTGNQELKDLLGQVKKQFQLAQSKLDNLSPLVTKLYGDVPSFEESISLPWLEFKHFDWYKKNVRSLRIKEKARSVLQRMHVSMQTMLATIHSVQQLKTFGKHLEPRKQLLVEIRSEVNAMLCESEVALLLMNATVPERVSADVVAWDTDSNDDTQLLVKDSGVLDKLGRSVRNWLRVLDDILSARSKNGGGGRRRNKHKSNGGKGGRGKQRTKTTRKPRRQPAQH